MPSPLFHLGMCEFIRVVGEKSRPPYKRYIFISTSQPVTVYSSISQGLCRYAVCWSCVGWWNKSHGWKKKRHAKMMISCNACMVTQSRCVCVWCTKQPCLKLSNLINWLLCCCLHWCKEYFLLSSVLFDPALFSRKCRFIALIKVEKNPRLLSHFKTEKNNLTELSQLFL